MLIFVRDGRELAYPGLVNHRSAALVLSFALAGCASGGFSRGLEGGGLFGTERCSPFTITPARAAPVMVARAPATPACWSPTNLRVRLDSLLRQGRFDRALQLAARAVAKNCPGASNVNDLVVAAKSALAELPASPDVAIREGLAAKAKGDGAKARMLFDAALLALEKGGAVPVVVEGPPDDLFAPPHPRDESDPATQPEDKRAPIELARFSLDGQKLVLAGPNERTALFDLRNASPPIVVSPRAEGYSMTKAMAISADGAFIAQRSADSAAIYATADGKLAAMLRGHQQDSEYSEPLHAVSFFWDSSHVATGDEKGTLRIFRRNDEKRLQETFSLRDNLDALATSPDSRYVASAFAAERGIRIRNASGGATVAFLPTATDEIVDIGWSTGGKHVAASALFGVVDVWDLSTCRRITIKDKPPCRRYEDGSCGTAALFGTAISPDGSRVAGAFDDDGVALWDGRTGARLAFVPAAPDDRASSVVFSNDGSVLVAGSAHGASLFHVRSPGASPALGPLVRITVLTNGGSDGYVLDLVGSTPDGAPRPTGHYDTFGMGDEALACRVGLRRVPLVVCEDRLRVPGLLGLRARGLPVDPLDVDSEP